MDKLTAIIVLTFGLCLTAHADIWKWVDDQGVVHYGDMPAAEYAKNAELVSYSHGSRPAATSSANQASANRGEDANPGETTEETRAREDAQAYYCKQAQDIYRSYVDAPRLYRTGDDGQREYLSDEEAAAQIANAEASIAEWCS